MVKMNLTGQFYKCNIVAQIFQAGRKVGVDYYFRDTECHRSLLVLAIKVVAQLHLQLIRCFPKINTIVFNLSSHALKIAITDP